MQKTEMRNPKTIDIDKKDTSSVLKLINEENYNSVKAVENAIPEITKAVDIIVDNIKRGGRLFYIGAGTSGRIAVADAAECPPTFGVPSDLIIAIMAGGDGAITKAAEDVEDSAQDGKRDILRYNICENDTVIGISASGNAEYVYSALDTANERGCTTISFSSNEDCKIHKITDIKIITDTGAEVITGSTRMKAGNAQKMVLNMISTTVMIKTGKVYENFMINLKPTNKKLRQRMIGIVSEVTGCNPTESKNLLKLNDWDIKKVIENREIK